MEASGDERQNPTALSGNGSWIDLTRKIVRFVAYDSVY